MLRSLPGAIDDALDTLYEPKAVFSQFLGSASMTFFFPFFLLFFLLFFPFLASSSCLVFSCFSCLILSFPFLFRFVPLFCLYFPFLYLLFFSVFLFSNSRTSVVRMRSDRYYVQYIGGSFSWVASGIIGFSRRE